MEEKEAHLNLIQVTFLLMACHLNDFHLCHA